MDFGQLDDVTRAQRRKRLPVVMTRSETQRVLAVMTGTHQLMAKLLYGTGDAVNGRGAAAREGC